MRLLNAGEVGLGFKAAFGEDGDLSPSRVASNDITLLGEFALGGENAASAGTSHCLTDLDGRKIGSGI
jgi:hypothetical protein